MDPDKYGRDLTRLQQEILAHLADPDAGDLTITVEIEATRPDGFPDDKSVSSPRTPVSSTSTNPTSIGAADLRQIGHPGR
jgi:hypothetical protein